jgi:hypothetical protein
LLDPKSFPKNLVPFITVYLVPGVDGVIFQTYFPQVQVPFSTLKPVLPAFVNVIVCPLQIVSFGETFILGFGLEDTYIGRTDPPVVPQGFEMVK